MLYDGIEMNQLMRGRNERKKETPPSFSPFISGIFYVIFVSNFDKMKERKESPTYTYMQTSTVGFIFDNFTS